MLKTKYLLPLILILLLTFTLIGDCWVSGYDQRIKLTIDHTKIDDTLSNFPVTVFFTDAQAEEIFAEFDADEDFDRGQFALGDGTLLYAEKELFDDSESKGLYHVKIPSISSSVDTDYYFYYDNDADHNTTYIGAIGTTAGENVWDSNFKAVYHMADATTSTILDSTSNDNDGTKKGANEPIEATGKVGQGQDFDGTDDKITVDDGGSAEDAIYTAELIMKFDGAVDLSVDGDRVDIIGRDIEVSKEGWFLSRAIVDPTNNIRFGTHTGNIQLNTNWGTDYHYIALVQNSNSDAEAFINGSSNVSGDNGFDGASTGDTIYIGTKNAGTDEFFGIIDEVRISGTNRSDAWIKATYNSLWDSLLTYGSEETKPSVTNIMFMFSNF